MIRRRTKRVQALLAAGLATLLVAGCSSATSGGGPKREAVDLSSITEGYIGTDKAGDPVDGGTLTMASFAEPRSLDPAVTIAALTTGGSEMLNIYDTLMRYEASDTTFVPQLAESLESDDNVTWTLRLRDGVLFSDGSTLDSAAVKRSQERYVALSGPESALWKANVTKVETPDPSTVVYTLAKPWAQFPGILSTGPGMVVGEKSGEGESFKPIGAGPFTLGPWAPQESLTLNARADYWDGKPHLDSVKFVYLPSALTALESQRKGEIDVAFVREPDQVEDVLKSKPHAYVNMTAAQNSALINASEGRPGEDPRVRKAMQLAIDTQLLTERAFKGAGGGSPTIFPGYSRWHGDTEGLAYDPDAAKELLEQAKADGFDGKIHYVDGSDPASRDTALAVKALLEAVGFEVEIDLMRTVADLINKVVIDRDYDVSAWGHSFRESDPIPKMFAIMHSTGNQLYGSYTSKAMDALLEEFQVAPSYEEQKAVMDRIQQQVNADVPFLVFGPYAETVVWNENVRAVTGAANSMVLYSKTWKS
ncbi:ABC transporter substrate-binding protein [Nocardioides daejeonensis]|uniref:ABC transporter substrate-binding protein n=1 Tax=Nocardioides daejeonensis TaxID=1046556 RepID=UPI000D742382|nr:ABC transporter substrate-binding protein [Nocardioides daejeonensis]